MQMNPRLRFILVTFYITAALVFAVYIRDANNRLFYKIRATHVKQNRLKQQLWQKQLQLENLLNPAKISEPTNEN